MMLQRTVPVENLVLVRNPKPCKAILKIGDYVKLNGISGGNAARVVGIAGREITVESQGWCGAPELIAFPRICLRKARFTTWLHKIWNSLLVGETTSRA